MMTAEAAHKRAVRKRGRCHRSSPNSHRKSKGSKEDEGARGHESRFQAQGQTKGLDRVSCRREECPRVLCGVVGNIDVDWLSEGGAVAMASDTWGRYSSAAELFG